MPWLIDWKPKGRKQSSSQPFLEPTSESGEEEILEEDVLEYAEEVEAKDSTGDSDFVATDDSDEIGSDTGDSDTLDESGPSSEFATSRTTLPTRYKTRSRGQELAAQDQQGPPFQFIDFEILRTRTYLTRISDVNDNFAVKSNTFCMAACQK